MSTSLIVTCASADTIVLTLHEATVPSGLVCGEIWSEAGLNLTITPTSGDNCPGVLCMFFSRPDRIDLVPAHMSVDLGAIGGVVNSAKIIVGTVCIGCAKATFYSGTTVFDRDSNTIAGFPSADTLEIFTSGMPVDRLALEPCFETEVFEIQI